jgi:hypothetical protein
MRLSPPLLCTVSLRAAASTLSSFWISSIGSSDPPAQERDNNPSLGPK